MNLFSSLCLCMIQNFLRGILKYMFFFEWDLRDSRMFYNSPFSFLFASLNVYLCDRQNTGERDRGSVFHPLVHSPSLPSQVWSCSGLGAWNPSLVSMWPKHCFCFFQRFSRKLNGKQNSRDPDQLSYVDMASSVLLSLLSDNASCHHPFPLSAE